jgi:hypothetical protein
MDIRRMSPEMGKRVNIHIYEEIKVGLFGKAALAKAAKRSSIVRCDGKLYAVPYEIYLKAEELECD